MPILPREENLFPDDLLESSFAQAEDAAWLVLHTKPRQEKSLARVAFAQEIPFYLPLVKKQNQIRGKVVDSWSPLFAGYLFACITDDQRVQLLKTNSIVQMVPVTDEGEMRQQLRSLQALIHADAPLTIERKLEAGRLVRVKSGPIAGTEGIVISRKGKSRLVVAVTLLQQGVSVEIDDFQVEPIY